MAELQDRRDSGTTVWWSRLHRALMPDYNRKATAYWWITVLIGGAAVDILYSTIAGNSSETKDVIITIRKPAAVTRLLSSRAT